MYGIETCILNQVVKHIIERFTVDFIIQLTQSEFDDWKSQIVISNALNMSLRKKPFAFTELGVAMLSSVLNSKLRYKFIEALSLIYKKAKRNNLKIHPIRS